MSEPMPEKEYQEILKSVPAHGSEKFLEYLRDNNRVVHENCDWLIIENIKYNSPDRPWHTAFWKHNYYPRFWDLPFSYFEWTWLKKSADKQSIKRFHIHLHK